MLLTALQNIPLNGPSVIVHVAGAEQSLPVVNPKVFYQHKAALEPAPVYVPSEQFIGTQ